MLWRATAGVLWVAGLLSPLAAQEFRQGPIAADRPGIAIEVGEAPERAIRGLSVLAPGDQRIEEALSRIVTLSCDEAPLGEVAEEIQRQLGVPVRLFNESWAGDVTDPDLKVSIEVDGVPLGDAIELLAGPEELSVFADNGILVIAHSRRGHEFRTTRIYHVPRLQPIGMGRLTTMITAWTSGPWDDDEPGTGTIRSYGNSLVVRQTLQNHRQIEAFLNLLTKAHSRLMPAEVDPKVPAGSRDNEASHADKLTGPRGAIEPLQQPGIEITISDAPPKEIRGLGELTPGDWQVETALRRIVTLRCRDVPLEDLAREIERKFEIPVELARGDHLDGIVDPKQKISVEAYNVPLHHAIGSLGDDPVWSYVTHGKLLFLPGGGCDNILPTRIYPVSRFRAVGFEQLADLIIQETSGPWDCDEPGTGTISSLGDAFVIRQTFRNHREIDSLLDVVDRLDIQPLPGEKVRKNAATVEQEDPAIGIRSGKSSTPTRTQVKWTSLGDLAFRSSERGGTRTDGTTGQDHAGTDSRTLSSSRFDVSAAPLKAMHGTGDLSPGELKVEAALRRLVTIRCEDMPLEDFARQLERTMGIPVRLQVGGPSELRVDPRAMVSIEVYGVPLSRALYLGRAIRWIAEGGELRFVHKDSEHEEPRRTRVYLVARFRDLELERLSELVQEETSGPWDDDEPGTGTLTLAGETFVVHQTPSIHREIEEFFEVLDRIDIRPVPGSEQLLKRARWEGGEFGGGFFGGESSFSEKSGPVEN